MNEGVTGAVCVNEDLRDSMEVYPWKRGSEWALERSPILTSLAAERRPNRVIFIVHKADFAGRSSFAIPKYYLNRLVYAEIWGLKKHKLKASVLHRARSWKVVFEYIVRTTVRVENSARLALHVKLRIWIY